MRIEIYHATAVILVVLIAALFSFDAMTGFVALGGGETHGSGGHQKGNPHYGVIKGYVTYVLRDVDQSVIESSAPDGSIYVYFVPEGSDVDWTAGVACESSSQSFLYNSTDPVLGLGPEYGGATSGTMNVTLDRDPAGADSAEMLLTLFDPDNEGEGEIYVNGNGPIDLPVIGDDGDDEEVVMDPFTINTGWLAEDENSVGFFWNETNGYEVRSMAIRLNITTTGSPIQGTLANVDADDSGDSCTSVNYQTPTLYECTGTLTGGGDVTLYRTNTSTESNNEGCFASKTPVGSYDIYV